MWRELVKDEHGGFARDSSKQRIAFAWMDGKNPGGSSLYCQSNVLLLEFCFVFKNIKMHGLSNNLCNASKRQR